MQTRQGNLQHERPEQEPMEGNAAGGPKGSALFSGLFSLFLIASCANPRPPSGGPRDETPPSIVESTPADGTVNVSTDALRLRFSEYVDPGSFTRAFTITPSFPGRLEFSWSGREVEVTFPEPLRDNTTYVINLSSDLQDEHGVELQDPITQAFATGPRINKGQLSGRVLDAATGEGLAEYNVYAYAAPSGMPPDSLPGRPTYLTQTNAQGQFQLEYLNEQPYFVLALKDDNRNRLPDPTESFAVPPQPTLFADTTGSEATYRWLASVQDTISPVTQRVNVFSSRRLELQFDEPIRLQGRDPASWLLHDSLRHTPVPVTEVFTRQDAPAHVYLLTDSLRSTPHVLTPGPVADVHGNLVVRDTLRFTPEALADTARLRFLGFLPGRTPADTAALLYPDEQPGLHLSEPVPEGRLRKAVTVRDTTGQPRTFNLETEDGTIYRLVLEPPLSSGKIVQVGVEAQPLSGRDTVYTRTYRRISERDLGSLSGVVTSAGDTAAAPIIIELITVEDEERMVLRRQRAGPEGRFLFSNLPERTYHFRAFVDRQSNREWNAGRIIPYRDAEPLTWTAEPLPWRARWENALSDTLRIPTR